MAAIDPNPSAAIPTALTPTTIAVIPQPVTATITIPPPVTATAARPIAPRILTPAPTPTPSPATWTPPYHEAVLGPYEKPWMHVLDEQQRKKARKLPKPSNPQKPLPSSNLHPKIGSTSSGSAAMPVFESNGHKNMRDKYKGDVLAVVKNRNVRITEGSSLYALCRSWLRNGFPEEIPSRHGSNGRSLPKPSPIPKPIEALQMKEHEEEQEDRDGEVEQSLEQGSDDAQEEGEESVENVSTEDLFKRHIKRAKKVRARLREVRLKRIARYKSRLALLLPPLVDQFRNDASGTAA